MAIPKFFHDKEDFRVDETVDLSIEEHRHALLSRRLGENSELVLLNGQGVIAKGRFVTLNKQLASVIIEQVDHHKPSSQRVIIASAIPKGNRQKVMLDMLTQAGVSDFIPLDCEFSSVKINEKIYNKWHRIIREACKQSGNPFCMCIHSSMSISQLVSSGFWQEGTCFRAEQNAGDIDDALSPMYRENNLLAIVGPEGGFSEPEEREIDHAGAQKMSFSEHILRTETAAIAAAIRLIAIRS